MSIETLDENNEIRSNEPAIKKPEFRRLTVKEILEGKKKKRRRFSLRLYKKWLKERAGQNVMPQKGTITFPKISPVERFRTRY